MNIEQVQPEIERVNIVKIEVNTKPQTLTMRLCVYIYMFSCIDLMKNKSGLTMQNQHGRPGKFIL